MQPCTQHAPHRPGAACQPGRPPLSLLVSSTRQNPHSHPARPSRPQAGSTASTAAAQPPLLLAQTGDSWGLQLAAAGTDATTQAAATHAPVVLLVDGTNLGCISAASSKPGRTRSSSSSALRQTTQQRFSAWLQFLAAVANTSGGHKATTSSSSSGASAGPLAAVLVAFDNKGSSLTNVRAQLQPNYLSKRYPPNHHQQQHHHHRQQQQQGKAQPAAAAPAPPRLQQQRSGVGVALSGWAELAGMVEQLNDQQQQQQVAAAGQAPPPMASTPAAAAAAAAAPPSGVPYLVAHAAYGFEADDVIAAAAQWCRSQLEPPPAVVIASSDSDMQQLLGEGTYWLELQQVASAQQPSGLLLHSASSFVQEYGFPPPAFPDYLALVGKEAGVTGVGMSPKLAKTLLAKFGSLEAILASRTALKPFGAAHKLLGEGQPGADARCAAAAANLAVLRMRPKQQQLPAAQLQQCYSRALEQLQGPGELQPDRRQLQSEQQQQQQQQQQQHVSWLHPARRLHMQQCQPYLAILQDSLAQLGLTQQHANWTSPCGRWCDLLVQVEGRVHVHAMYDSSSNDSGGGGSSDGDRGGGGSGSSDGVRLVFQILGPADLSAGAPGLIDPQDYDQAVAALGQHLADSCGSFQQGTSALGHPKRALMQHTSGGAKRQLSLLKGLQAPLVAVPFFELDACCVGQQVDADRAVLQYVRALLAEHVPGLLQ